MSHRQTLAWLLLICLALPALGQHRVPRAHAQAVAAVVSAPVQVSGPSPFLAGCEGVPLTSRVYTSSAVETNLAVDPLDPKHLVAVWQQDRFAAGAARGVVAAVSRDGGATWTQSMASFARCEGGTPANGGDYERASDPWVSFGPDGSVYQIALATDAPESTQAVTAILVSKSTDGGTTWGAATTLIRDQFSTGFNDKGSITADPADPRSVYAVWDRLGPAPPDQRVILGQAPLQVLGPSMFSRSTDGGASWETPRVIYDPRTLPADESLSAGESLTAAETTGNIIAVLPNGDLVDVFALTRGLRGATGLPSPPAHEIAMIRSTDKGATWSDPVRVSAVVRAQSGQGVFDPNSGQPLRTGELLPAIAVDRRSGQIDVAWEDARFSRDRHEDIALTTSNDEGQTWSDPTRLNQTPGGASAFTPSIAVGADGTVGVSYYDLRSNTPNQSAILADTWLATCKADCTTSANWSEAHIAGPFDMQRAPYAGGFFLGDYEGLASAGGSFQILFAAADPAGNADFSDVFSASAALP